MTYTTTQARILSMYQAPTIISGDRIGPDDIMNEILNAKHIELDATVHCIKDDTFRGCRPLVSLMMDSVCTIGEDAFRDCTSLERIMWPKGLRHIGNDAFRGCTSLKTVILPNGVQYIGDRAFKGCESVHYIEIPSTVTHIGSDAFKGCTNAHVAAIEGCVTHEGDFGDCRKVWSPNA